MTDVHRATISTSRRRGRSRCARRSDAAGPVARDRRCWRGGSSLRDDDFIVDELPLYEPARGGRTPLHPGAEDAGSPTRNSSASAAPALQGEGGGDRRGGDEGPGGHDRPDLLDPPCRGGSGPPAEAATALEDSRVQIVWADWHTNKLRRGHLKAAIVSRSASATSIRLQAPAGLAGDAGRSSSRGVPNHYGTQRFGYRRNTHRLGRAGPGAGTGTGWPRRCSVPTGSWFPAHQRSSAGGVRCGSVRRGRRRAGVGGTSRSGGWLAAIAKGRVVGRGSGRHRLHGRCGRSG